MAESPSNRKVANSLVALSSAAVLAVYAAGYTRTRGAAAKFETQTAERRPAPMPAPAAPAPPANEPPITEPGPALSQAPKTESPKPSATTVEPQPDPAPAPPAAVVETAPAPEAPPPSPPPPAPPAPPPAPTWKDGTYTGWGTSRHGDIQAQVVIESGRIASATIAQCLTRYSCSVIEKLPPEVAQRQSPEVDYVSGATQSANAFYYAVVEALNKAK